MPFLKNRPVLSWCLYDWANSVLATIIFTFVFAVYFSRAIVGDETIGSAYWGYAVGIAGAIIAVAGPVLGAVTDVYGPRKPLLAILTGVTVLSTAGLFFALPDPSFILPALILVAVATIGFELAQAQYNAMLPGLAPASRLGRISGWAWGLGYLGGLVCLLIALTGFIGLGEQGGGFLRLSEEQGLNVRATCLLAAGWYVFFALPLFLYTPDVPRRRSFSLSSTIHEAFTKLKATFRALATGSRNVGLYLVASALYRDGLNTLFAVGGLYAAGTFGMSFRDILVFAIGLNVTAGLGALAFAAADDRFGAKAVIVVSLVSLIALGLGIVLVDDKTAFMVLALALGIFIGPVQSASRSLMARLASAETAAELFGLYAMTGKAVAFLGPLCFAAVTHATGSQRWGVATILVFWGVGLALILKVRER